MTTNTGKIEQSEPSREIGPGETAVLAVVAELVRELHPRRAKPIDISVSSRLEQDLGIDSLARTELVLRIERAAGIRLAADVIGRAETIADLLPALAAAEDPMRAPRGRVGAPATLPIVPAATDARTLIEMLDRHVARHPDRLHLTFLQDDATILGSLTYGRLATEARRVAMGLIARDIVPGDRVALMLPTGLEFFIAFFGILYAGAVPVPIYPPMRLSRIEDHLRRQAGILRNAGARLLVTVPEGRALAGLLRGQVATLAAVESLAGLTAEAGDLVLPPSRDEAATALIQYTSGSTGDPKGVVLSHANLLANVRAMGRAIEASSADIFMSWLPLYHDMGLIGAWLGCLHFAAPFYVMSPLSFLARPASWLWAIHRTRATLGAAPNFGFELCLEKIDEASLEGLDLGSLRMVANGAEPVSAHTLRRFTERFAKFGFRPSAMAPVYGLAENAVGLAFPPPGRAPIIDRVDRDALTFRGTAEPAGPDDPSPLEIVACGQPLPGHEIRIVDADGREVGERREGRLEFRGPSATAGYFRNEAKTRALFRDGWLDSGDRAYLARGDVFVTGRAKDIIIRAGRHLYPQEIEEAIAGIPGIRKGGVAVFGAPDPVSGTERVVVIAETRATETATLAALEARAREAMIAIAGTPPDEIVLAPPRTVPKTSSGKIRRGAAREFYLQRRIGAPERPLWRQILGLSIAGAVPRASRLSVRLGDLLYALWWWIVIAAGYVLAWIGVMALPGLDRRWAFVRGAARIVMALLRVPVSVRGLENVPTGHAMLVFNHASYMDVCVLTAVLPDAPAFVAKREFSHQIFAGPFMRRLGTLFLDRSDFAASLADTRAVIAETRRGRNLVFFPEGGFSRRAGLCGFYLGAFEVAAEAGLPVVPGTLRGTRTMLRGGQWFPRWTPVSVQIDPAIVPESADFAAVLRLRDSARAAVLAQCGEPDLDELTVHPPDA
jgi:1-acyl-sn-glycerol-3-phosphate acyltransferase